MKYQAQVLRDIHIMNTEELEYLYGIEITENAVYDLAEGRTFDTLEKWAMFVAENEEDDGCSTFQKIRSKISFDDERSK